MRKISKRAVVAFVAGGVVVGVAVGSAVATPSRGQVPVFAPDAQVVRTAMSVANSVAIASGARLSNVTSVRFVETLRGATDKYFGITSHSNQDQKVVLIREVGNFAVPAAPRPPGTSAPRGRYLTVIADAATGKVLGGNLSPHKPLALPASAKVLVKR